MHFRLTITLNDSHNYSIISSVFIDQAIGGILVVVQLVSILTVVVDTNTCTCDKIAWK